MFTTLEDVARVAGCSLATVSRAINGSAAVAEDVRAKVSAAVKHTGYKPRRRRSPAAANGDGAPNGRGMPVINVLFHRSGSYEVLTPTAHGVKVGAPHVFHAPDLQNPQYRRTNNFEQGLLEGLLEGCSHFGVKAGIISTDNLQDPKLLEEVGGTGHGGLIVAGIWSGGLEGFLARCRQPVVLLDILHRGEPDVVTSDNIDGMRQAVAHLAALGHRDIGFVGTRAIPGYYERHTGFLAAMAEAGLEARREWMVDTPGGVAETARLVAPLL
ncbi:MAG: LacI family transcriptional regulator, partial [Kiritimatiellaeota bacterium]|nr:LacI family transcriptional regulator [Kiritimatiellota bacterium]